VSRAGAETLELSHDPEFAAEMTDVVRLYFDVREHELVPSVDRTSGGRR
jgi:hypothetical protein